MGKFDVLLNLILKKMHQVNTVTYIPEMRNRRLPEWEWHVMGSVASMCTAQPPSANPRTLLGSSWPCWEEARKGEGREQRNGC